MNPSPIASEHAAGLPGHRLGATDTEVATSYVFDAREFSPRHVDIETGMPRRNARAAPRSPRRRLVHPVPPRKSTRSGALRRGSNNRVLTCATGAPITTSCLCVSSNHPPLIPLSPSPSLPSETECVAPPQPTRTTRSETKNGKLLPGVSRSYAHGILVHSFTETKL